MCVLSTSCLSQAAFVFGLPATPCVRTFFNYSNCLCRFVWKPFVSITVNDGGLETLLFQECDGKL